MSDWGPLMTERVDILPRDVGKTRSGTMTRTPEPGPVASDVPCSIQHGRSAEARGFGSDVSRSAVGVFFDQDVALEVDQRLRDRRDDKVLRVVSYKPVPFDMGLYRATCVEV